MVFQPDYQNFSQIVIFSVELVQIPAKLTKFRPDWSKNFSIRIFCGEDGGRGYRERERWEEVLSANRLNDGLYFWVFLTPK